MYNLNKLIMSKIDFLKEQIIESRNFVNRLVSEIPENQWYTIPEGTQTDTEFRIRGKGIQQLGSNNKGDLIFKVRVETPRRLTEKQRELLRQFDGDDNGKQYDQRKTFIDKVKELFDK